MCLPPIRHDGGLDFPSLLEFEKWGVATGQQIKVLPEADVIDQEFARKAAARLAADGAGK